MLLHEFIFLIHIIDLQIKRNAINHHFSSMAQHSLHQYEGDEM